MRIKRWIVLSLAAALATLMLTGCPWDQDRPGGGASSQPGGDGVIVVPPGGDDDGGGDDPPVTYTITATAGTGGTAQPATQTVTAGQDASVAVAASDGYCIQQITVDGDVQFTAADASRTEYTVQFPAVDASHTVEASFAQVYTVTASIGTGGPVKNVKLADVQITSDHQYGNAGGVAGYSRGNIENCSVSGSVSSNYSAGGVVGFNGTGSILTACYATGNVTGTGTGTGSCYVGGVTGDNFNGTLTACYHAAETVSGPDGATGGVTGRNYNASVGIPSITACYWQNNQAQGIGDNHAGTGETTKVTDGDWTDAVKQMNAALSGTGYSYQQGNPPKLN